jgi:uncharacterized protein (DUF849 family)
MPTKDCYNGGATMLHIHVRANPKSENHYGFITCLK